MRVLIVKLSSMGDLVHTLPALTEALNQLPGLEVTWLVEKNFAEILQLPKGIKKLIISDLRNWRKSVWSTIASGILTKFVKELRAEPYDLIIDAQGLLKSAILASLARGPVAGFDRFSIREKIASFFYKKRISVAKNLHATERSKQLFAKALNYVSQKTIMPVQWAKKPSQFNHPKAFCVLILPTTWPNKHYPLTSWLRLAELLGEQGLDVLLPAHTSGDQLKIQGLLHLKHCQPIPPCSIIAMYDILLQAHSVIGVDTGLTHLSAALDKPTINLFGPSSALLSGSQGAKALNLSVIYPCAPCLKRHCSLITLQGPPPCFESLSPMRVMTAWQELTQAI